MLYEHKDILNLSDKFPTHSFSLWIHVLWLYCMYNVLFVSIHVINLRHWIHLFLLIPFPTQWSKDKILPSSSNRSEMYWAPTFANYFSYYYAAEETSVAEENDLDLPRSNIKKAAVNESSHKVSSIESFKMSSLDNTEKIDTFNNIDIPSTLDVTKRRQTFNISRWKELRKVLYPTLIVYVLWVNMKYFPTFFALLLTFTSAYLSLLSCFFNFSFLNL